MAFKMRGAPFTKMDEKTAKQKYEEAAKDGKVVPRSLKNLMYKITGDTKYLEK